MDTLPTNVDQSFWLADHKTVEKCEMICNWLANRKRLFLGEFFI